jgi:hypothetical protein
MINFFLHAANLQFSFAGLNLNVTLTVFVQVRHPQTCTADAYRRSQQGHAGRSERVDTASCSPKPAYTIVVSTSVRLARTLTKYNYSHIHGRV